MEILHLSSNAEQAERLQYHLAPLGIDVHRRDDIWDLIQTVERLDVAGILCDIDSFPRLWKPLLQRLRSAGVRSAGGLPELPVLLLSANEPEFEEAAKASHLGANVSWSAN